LRFGSFFPSVTHHLFTKSTYSGGGIGGLTLAYALSRSNAVEIDIYEATTRFTEVGAGVALTWRTRRTLAALNLQDDLTAIGAQFDDTLGERYSENVYSESDGTPVPVIGFRKSNQEIGLPIPIKGSIVTYLL
jgi:hypothetical protein